MSNRQPKIELISGAKAALPLMLGAIPFAILFGTLAPTSGLTPLATIAMSIFVFAGSAQFIVLALIVAKAPLEMILLTTFVVNLRHILYATALVEHVKDLPMKWRAVLAFGLTDETFANMSQRYLQRDKEYAHYFYLGSMCSFYLTWVSFTILGVLLGTMIPDMSNWGLEFAMSVTFIGMVVPYMDSKAMISAIIAAGFSSLIFAQLPNKLGLIISALIGVMIGLTISKLSKRQLSYE
ncbi:branched-chain amino acid ABC transporter permease [Psychromonas sp. psych-6C06]|uniref:AzlC family ABC transporter permease n=1 Tax=Psychromonas sp. psych-6C06 TaxID=2058089 RepID=UPI000C3435F2|nr:AzlC family ABC transporter permease [Psychromonas sp. psych-6C06]PKF60225.1 branched-chain amino acid ABC transporter permease [Psychromonas sp. psych-6C06]